MDFYYGNMIFEVPESVYYPAEDSLLMAKAIEKLDLSGKTILEIGCGSGFLSIIMAKKGALVTSADINSEAVKATKENAERLGCNLTSFDSDLFSNVTGRFDLIVLNPPYLPVEEGETDITYAGGATGREVIERFVSKAKDHLKPEGIILLLISSLTGEKEVMELFIKHGMKVKSVAREKIEWEELIVIEAHQELGQARPEAGQQ
ncbi:MAG: HemK2/MTQ2 family protein methyltransferase [Candidatus Aenigmatarchaeota archaeon]